MDPQVQSLLKDLTGMDFKKIFRKRKTGQKLKEPSYTFMTEAQLEEALEEAKLKAQKLLQMPPVLPPRQPIDEIISFDPIVQGIEKPGVTLVFTDTSILPSINDRNRIVLARDPNGTLRKASWEEREKMNKIYFPTPGRAFVTPKMFTDPQILKEVLSRASAEDNTYEFVLDRACLQFEPDDPIYISAVETVYDTINSRQHYDYLHSTRHYGPMVFHYLRFRNIDNLLSFYIKEERIPDAGKLISLFQMIYPESKTALTKSSDEDTTKISQYIQLDAVRKSELTLIFTSYLELVKSRTELEKGLQKAHGVQ